MPIRGHSTTSISHTGSDWKLRQYRHSTSALHGALELQQSLSWEKELNLAGDVEQSKPKRRSRTETVDGRKVTFALMKEVNQMPEISRKERLQSDWRNINVDKSSAYQRMQHELQQYLMQQSIPLLTVYYLGFFLLQNAFFAAFWYSTEDKCCDDPNMTFAEIFNFAVQTSSTIGYGGYWPKGYFNNALVVLVTVLSICQATVYAGLLFFRFITPQCNVHFSEVITMSNVLGRPCFEIRIGNADGKANKLINVDASLCVTSVQEYEDPDDYTARKVVQTEDLQLAVSTQHKLNGVWTIRHFVDEKSPLYGFRFDEFPGNAIYSIQLNVKAIQEVTKGEVYSQTAYQVHDIMIGHRFVDMAIWDPKTRRGFFDYDKLSAIQPSFVWYPTPGCEVRPDNSPVVEHNRRDSGRDEFSDHYNDENNNTTTTTKKTDVENGEANFREHENGDETMKA
mmetsp:Transcript_7420/g.17769  ORF Transcript_7420/g.17769 Transcript_7420/m.17769 type:complete len:452 (-) Transcript_7420:283-1638(-)